MVTAQVIAAETDATAQLLFTTTQRSLRLMRNQPVERLPPVNSTDSLRLDRERQAVENKLCEVIVASDAAVKAGLESLVGGMAAGELIVVTDTYDHADRLLSHEQLAHIAATVPVSS